MPSAAAPSARSSATATKGAASAGRSKHGPSTATSRGGRGSGTVQKDWTIIKSNALPPDFCIAVVGHRGWSQDPDSTAKYALAVSFEVVGREIAIYEDVRVAVEELQAELEALAEVQAEVEEA